MFDRNRPAMCTIAIYYRLYRLYMAEWRQSVQRQGPNILYVHVYSKLESFGEIKHAYINFFEWIWKVQFV